MSAASAASAPAAGTSGARISTSGDDDQNNRFIVGAIEEYFPTFSKNEENMDVSSQNMYRP